MSTFVLPLWGNGESPAPKKTTLDDLETLVDYIDSNEIVQQSLNIDYGIGYGIWQTRDLEYVIAADLSHLTWGEILDRPGLDVMLQQDWGRWVPKEEDWQKMRLYVSTILAATIVRATGHPIDPKRIRFSIRRKVSKKAKIYKVFIM